MNRPTTRPAVRAHRRRLLQGLLIAALASLGNAAPAREQPASAPASAPAAAPVTWRMATEYPASAMPGEGLSTFADEVKARSGGTLVVSPSYGAGAGITSAQMPAAVREGRVEGGDAFAGALGEIDPIFLLSSLPFVATSLESARRLAELARSDYARAFAAQGQRLLYITPWPPTGLWSRVPLARLDDLRAMTVRTYDETSTEVMRTAGAHAIDLSFSDAIPRLRDGSVNAALTSGDGGAGRKLWTFLPNFTAIDYAMPLSFTTVSNAAYAGLTPAQREAVDAAAQATEQRQWARLSTRIAENAAHMMENGVTVRGEAAPAVREALRAAGAGAVSAWRARVGKQGAAILDAFEASGGAR